LLPTATVDHYSGPALLLKEILAQAFGGRITHALAQSLQAELAARILVTQRARSNCDDRLRQLEDQWRVVQKEQVTTELSEVVAARRVRAGD
jgi:F0F1-type ATP synthase gamma subunit